MNSKYSQEAIEHQRLASLINSMGDGVIALDENLNIVMYNGAALNILDVNTSMEDRPLSSVFELIDETNQLVDIEGLVRKSNSSTSFRDYRLKYKDGSTLNLFLSVAPVHMSYGVADQNGYVLIIRDITREKSLEEERDEFISVVSHELRTPIAITEANISNAQFIVEKTGDIVQVTEALNQAHTQTVFLAGLINDLATLSRAERGKLEVDLEDINTTELCNELLHDYTKSAENNGLKLELSLDPNLGTLSSGRLYTKEVLQNFITNAIKYTVEGTITIGAEQKPNGVLFWVRDTGIGISKVDQQKVFDKFFRSEDYRTRENTGTGLGLYVTMKLARIIHANIDVESKLNEGSTFRIFIPDILGSPEIAKQ